MDNALAARRSADTGHEHHGLDPQHKSPSHVRLANKLVDSAQLARDAGADGAWLYLVLCRHAKSKGLCSPSRERMAELTCRSKRHVDKLLDLLEAGGWIRRIKQPKPKSTIYDLRDGAGFALSKGIYGAELALSEPVDSANCAPDGAGFAPEVAVLPTTNAKDLCLVNDSSALPGTATDSTPSPEPTPPPGDPFLPQIKIVHSVYQQRRAEHQAAKGERARQVSLSEKIASKIRARLRDGFTVQDLKDAVSGIFILPWNLGENPDGREHLSEELVFRDAEKVNQYLSAWRNRDKVKRSGNGKAPSFRGEIPAEDELKFDELSRPITREEGAGHARLEQV